jgi:MoaA/NifB/PqqE/SkfB family radical SAM enzyme
VFSRDFDLDGCHVRVRGEGADLATVIDLLLGPYAAPVPASSSPVIAIALGRGPRAAPPAGPPRFVFPPLSAFASSRGWRLIDDVADVTVRPGEKASGAPASITGVIEADASLPALSQAAGLTLWVALIECLRARGRYPLHAAALVAPDGRVVLVPGTKGAGKSTMTLALLERGFAVVSDDTLFVERSPSGTIELLGYRKRFHVRPDLVARRPDLAALVRPPAAYEPQDKRWLALGEDRRFAARVRERAGAPTEILFPRIVDADDSARTPIAGKDALLELLAASAFVFVRPELTPDHLAILSALVDGATCARLACGRDLIGRPERYLELVTRAEVSSATASAPTSWPAPAPPSVAPRALPTSLGLELTDRCDLQCAHCLRHIVAPSSTRATDMPLAVARRAISEAKALGLRHVGMTGGEPRLHPGFLDIVDHIVDEGLSYHFLSNGIGLPAWLPTFLSRPERRAGLREVAVSLDGATERTHDAIRGAGTFKRALAGLATLRAAGIPFILLHTITRKSKDELDQLGLVAHHLGAERLIVCHFLPSGRPGATADLDLTSDERHEVEFRLKRLIHALRFEILMAEGYYTPTTDHICSTVELRTLNVDPRGHLTFCCELSNFNGDDRAAEERPDFVADLARVSIAEAIELQRRAVEAFRAARLADEAEGKRSEDDKFACRYCIRHFGKPEAPPVRIRKRAQVAHGG